MRFAILSDIHGNLTALEAVLADLCHAAPDLILHGGDLADGGSSPAEVVDRLRDQGCAGVLGNGDELLFRPATLEAFVSQSAAPATLWSTIRSMAEATREALGAERLEWLESLPLSLSLPEFALVHASPESCWHAPPADASDDLLEATYAPLARRCVIYAHTHLPLVRHLRGFVSTIANAGSVGLPFDGDPRAAYLLVTDGQAELRRVAYDIDLECRRLRESSIPSADWMVAMLRSAAPALP